METPSVIYQDEQILILDKPAGWVVNRAASVKVATIQGWLKENCHYPIAGNDTLRSGIVHRLDKETSGILLVAKQKDAFEDLQAQFKKRRVNKKYTALLHGELSLSKGKVNVPIGRTPWNRRRFGVVIGGRSAISDYRVKKVYRAKGEDYSLVQFFPKTGRTHQIRVHAKHLGHPIVGDNFYAGRKVSNADRTWCPRLFLHAEEISFVHPETGERLQFVAKIPDDLTKALDHLRSSD